MKYILDSDLNWFEKEEAAIDGADELCPICGCCSLVEAEVVPGSIFNQAEQILSGTPLEHRLVCAGGCEKNLHHQSPHL